MAAFWNTIFRSTAGRMLFYIFIADIFYDDGGAFLYKRLIFSAFIYMALFELIYFYYNTLKFSGSLNLPVFARFYTTTFILFILLFLFKDFTGPNLNIVTLINNPYALLTIVPVTVFLLGSETADMSGVFNVLCFAGIIFLAVWVVQPPGNIKYYEGYVASQAFVPFFIICFVDKKKLWAAVALMVLAIPFSMVSDQRIILLKAMGFSGLFISMTFFRKNNFMKALIMLAGGTVVFLMLTNLGPILNYFQGLIGSKTFDVNDTRSFLYEELFDDLKMPEFFLGRGFLGTYFSDYFLMLIENLDDSGDFYQRFSVEVGFLQLVLKGGYAYYILYTIPLWFVAIKCIFSHADLQIPFYIGIYIFIELLLMFFGNTPYFGFQFSLLFLFAGYAYGVISRWKQLNQSSRPLILYQND